MALNALSTRQMFRISDQLSSEQGHRPKLMKLKRASSWVDDVVQVHADIVTAHHGSLAEHGRIAGLRVKQKAADGDHDDLLGGLHLTLEAYEALARFIGLDPTKVARARIELFPDGLRMARRSYAEEAAEVILVEHRLSESSKALLAALGANGKPLSSLVDAWLDAARLVGKLEDEREALEVEHKAAKQKRVSLRDARNNWVEVIAKLRDAIEFDTKDDPATGDELLYRLRRFEARAATKADDAGDDDLDGDAPAAAPTAAAAQPDDEEPGDA
jgi:hypothetical protein